MCGCGRERRASRKEVEGRARGGIARLSKPVERAKGFPQCDGAVSTDGAVSMLAMDRLRVVEGLSSDRRC